MRLLLIRHGQTVDNARGVLGAVIPGPGLTELGIRQAEAIPGALASEPIEAIYASRMVRTQLTAAPLARERGLDVQVMDGIHEISAGDLEQRDDQESIRLYVGTVFSWWRDFGARIPGGENGHEFYSRFDRAIGTIAASHEGTVAVVSHGAAIRAWASWSAVNLDAEYSRTHPLENTGVVVVEGSPADGWRATSWAGEPVGGLALEDASAPDPTGGADPGLSEPSASSTVPPA
jgi:probable phosphoglycerate mutase